MIIPKILIVEDDKETRDWVTILVEREGYDAVIANNGEEGLLAFSIYRPDLVITDLVMPRLNGIELIHVLRSADSTTAPLPIIALTGYFRDHAATALTAGATRALPKPIDPEVLLANIKILLARETFSNAPPDSTTSCGVQ